VKYSVTGAAQIAIAVAAFSGALMAAPAAAQGFSDGYKLLEAVKKLDGNKVTDMLSDPAINVNTRDSTTGETALHIVTRKRSALWIDFLAQRGANPNLADVRGVTPLMVAVGLNFVEGVDRLIAAGARVDTPNDTGETPLISAVHARNAALVRALLKAGANPSRADNSGRTARDYALLDGKQNAILTEIDNAAKAKTGAAGGKVFGPMIP